MSLAFSEKHKDHSLHQALASYGYTSEKIDPGGRIAGRRILRDGVEVCHGRACHVWAWLEAEHGEER